MFFIIKESLQTNTILTMKRKTFLKLSSAIAATPMLSLLQSSGQQEKLKNWAGNLEYSTSNVFYPQSVEEVQGLVKKSSKLRALGTRHCINTIADSKYNLISTK
jgi:xylitol oxidase